MGYDVAEEWWSKWRLFNSPGHAPGVGAATRLPDCPALLLGIRQGLPDMFVWVVRHFHAILLDLRLTQLYTTKALLGEDECRWLPRGGAFPK